jgi:fatty-acyl-CoA synthase
VSNTPRKSSVDNGFAFGFAHNQNSLFMNIPLDQYGDLFAALAAAPAEQPFVTEWHDESDQCSVTFGEFRHRAQAQASFLKSEGVRAGDRVVLILRQGITLMTAFAGAMMLGAVPAILAYPNFKVDPAKYRQSLRGVTSNLRAPFLLVDAQFPDPLLANLDLDAATKFLRSPNEIATHHETLSRDATIRPDQLAFIQHSAGTTGLQKGVALTHAAVLRQLRHLTTALNITSDDRLYSWLPLYHDMGLIACFILPMVCHLPVVMQSPSEWVQRPETMLQLFTRHRCTLAWMPNFAFQFIPRRTPERLRSQCDLSSARAIINCSEPVRSQSMQEFLEAFAPHGLPRSALQSSYAMAENVFAVTQSGAAGPLQIYLDGQRFRSEHLITETTKDASGAVPLTSSGRLLPNNEVRIVDEQRHSLPPGAVGEILVRSDSLFDGYFHRPDLTARVLEEGWYCTGDLGFLLHDELFVVGRRKDLLIIGGENIYPQDIEELVSAHPAIHDGRAVALGFFNRDLGTEDLAVVAEVNDQVSVAQKKSIEREIRASVLAQLNVAIRYMFLKPPMWIVKSTAGKPARSGTREKLQQEHPELPACL